MNLEDLKALGGVIPAEPELVDVEWDDRLRLPDGEGRLPDHKEWTPTFKGKVHTFQAWVKQLSAGDMERVRKRPADDEEAERSVNALLISECVMLGEKGDQRISYEDAFRLKPPLSNALLVAIGGVYQVKT